MDQPISQLPIATTLTGVELIPIVQNGITKQAQTSQLANVVSPGKLISSAGILGSDILFNYSDGTTSTAGPVVATVAIGSTTTLSPGSSATVTNSGSSANGIFNFGIPKGDPGDTGAGVAAGGTTGQILAKASNTNYDTTWVSDTNGTVTSVSGSGGTTGLTLTGGPITSTGTLTLGGTLAVANGGTGVTTSTGSGNVVFSTSPTLVNPILGTPTSVTLTNATGLPIVAGTTGTLSVARGGTGLITLAAGSIPYGAGTSNYVPLAIGTAGQVLTVNSGATAPQWSNLPAGMVYPGAGIPNSTGGAWGTSYGVTGTGSVVLNSNPSFATDITVNGLTAGRGAGNVSTNTAYGFDAIGSPYIISTNTNNVGIGYNALNTIGVGVATLTNRVGGSGYDDGFSGEIVSLIYQLNTPILAGGVFPTVILTISGGVITDVTLATKGYGFTDTTTVFTINNADVGGVGSGFSIQIGSLASASNNTALGYNAGNTAITNSNSVYIGSGATGTGENQIVIGANVTGQGENTVNIGNDSTTFTYLKGNVTTPSLASGAIVTNDSFFCTLPSDASKSFTVSNTGASTINLGIMNVGSGAINIGRSTGTTDSQAVNIGGVGNQINVGASSGASTINIGGTTATGTIILGRSTGLQTVNIQTGTTGSGSTFIGGTSATGGITLGRSTVTQTVSIATGSTASTRVKSVNIGTGSLAGSSTDILIGSTSGTSTTTIQGYFKPTALASAPTYVKGAVYFDTTLNKLRVGGATTWETITSV
jgi:hypothetical protein